ncbi:hypothetical protein DFH06DRAFT_644367 [Mycena polygramma]|nr:hypothetical protein DFH06DRAFT_644367 [Mycena polygramma]
MSAKLTPSLSALPSALCCPRFLSLLRSLPRIPTRIPDSLLLLLPHPRITAPRRPRLRLTCARSTQLSGDAAVAITTHYALPTRASLTPLEFTARSRQRRTCARTLSAAWGVATLPLDTLIAAVSNHGRRFVEVFIYFRLVELLRGRRRLRARLAQSPGYTFGFQSAHPELTPLRARQLAPFHRHTAPGARPAAPRRAHSLRDACWLGARPLRRRVLVWMQQQGFVRAAEARMDSR